MSRTPAADANSGVVRSPADPDAGFGVAADVEPIPGLEDFLGAKVASVRQVLRRMPPHSLYVEAFLGGGAVARHKVPALRTIGVEIDPEICERWRRARWPGVELVEACVIAWLEEAAAWLPFDALVYADPPYRHCTRGDKRYRYELTDEQHLELLGALDAIPCSVMVSGYPSTLYDVALAGWSREEFPAMTRGGPRTEVLWWRSSVASSGVGARFIGRDRRQRWNVKKRVRRWTAKFSAMPPSERAAVLHALLDVTARATPPAASPDLASGTSMLSPAPQGA